MAEVLDNDDENITYQVVDPDVPDDDEENIEPPFVIVV
jgi:hypothetical protein